MITTTTTKQKNRGRKSILHDESCPVLRSQLWIDLAVLRKSSVAVCFGMTSKIKSEKGPLNMDCIYLYTASLHNGEKGNGEGGCAVRSGPAVCHKWHKCCTCADPWWTHWDPQGARCSLAADVRLQALAHHGAFFMESIVWCKSQWGL